jgi:hypothetical protein
MLLAEGTILVQRQTIRGVLLVLVGVVVPLLALRALQSDLDASALLCHTCGTSFNVRHDSKKAGHG